MASKPTPADVIAEAVARTIANYDAPGFTPEAATVDRLHKAVVTLTRADSLKGLDAATREAMREAGEAMRAAAVSALESAHAAYVKQLAKSRGSRREAWLVDEGDRGHAAFVTAVEALVAAYVPAMVRVTIAIDEDGSVTVRVPDPAAKAIDPHAGPRTNNGGQALVVTMPDGKALTLLPPSMGKLPEWADAIVAGTAFSPMMPALLALTGEDKASHPNQNPCGVVKRLVGQNAAAENRARFAGWSFTHGGTDCLKCQCGQGKAARKRAGA